MTKQDLSQNYNFKRLSRPGDVHWDDIIRRLINELISRGGKTSKEDLEWLLLNYYALPNSPALASAGTKMFCASACSAYPVYDTMFDHKFSIMGSLGIGVKALKAGIGIGFNFSQLRSKMEKVQGRTNVTGGPVSFLKSYNGFISEVNQLTRKAACMSLLHVSHPDIKDYICCKTTDGELDNFNISVLIDDKFMNAVADDQEYELKYITEDKTVKVKAREIFDLMCQRMWDNGEPGVMFENTIQDDYFDRSQKMNILANPCSEALLSWGDDWLELCVLASINLPKYVTLTEEDKRRVVDVSVRMLNDIIDTQDYVCEEHQYGAKKLNRKIGVGIAGLATVLGLKNIRYSSDQAFDFTKGIFREIGEFALQSSSKLGDVNGLGRYNSSLLSVAPTSTLSRIFDYVNEEGCSWGIEPYFDVKTHIVKNSYGEFEQKEKIVEVLKGKVDHIECANDLTYQQHLRPLIAYYTSNPAGMVQGCSKTINFSNNVTIEDIKDAVFYCWRKGIKAVSFYRDGSRKDQVMNLCGSDPTSKPLNGRPEKVVYHNAPKRPEDLPCHIYHVQSEHQKWIVLVGLYKGDVYEVFCGLEEKIKIPWKYNEGVIRKNKTYHLVLGDGDDELVINDIPGIFENKQHSSLSRLVSMSLRHGVPLKFCIEQLLKDGGFDAMNRAIARVLKKYLKEREDANRSCPQCGKDLYYIQGCLTCVDPTCNYSKCS